jgi:signal transduction histidine kinase
VAVLENNGRAAGRVGQQILETFHRLRPDRVGSAHGAGLGLSIVQAVVRAHDGTVQALTRPGGGLVITLQLPAVASEESVRTPEANGTRYLNKVSS